MDAQGHLIRNLQQLMRARGLDSQPKLSRASGVSQSQVGSILRGEKSPSLGTLVKLAQALRVPTYVLLMSPDDPALELMREFHRCDPSARETVLSVAHAQARLALTES